MKLTVTLTLKFAAALLFLSSVYAQSGIPAGSKVYVGEDKGFEIYLSAALAAKHVDLQVVADKSQADFELQVTSDHRKNMGYYGSIIMDWASPAWPYGQWVHGNDSAAIRVIDKTGKIIFAYAVDRNNSFHGRQTAAESCAKHLKLAMSNAPNPTAGPVKRAALWSVTKGDPALDF